MGKSNSLPPAGHYNANYGNFSNGTVRRDSL